MNLSEIISSDPRMQESLVSSNQNSIFIKSVESVEYDNSYKASPFEYIEKTEHQH